MRLIKNPWQGIPGYDCFGCCPDNPIGLHMHFYEEGDDVVSLWHPNENYQSWKNTLHGGIQAVLLDEICGWVVFHKLQLSGVTAKMETRYRHPVSTLQPYIEMRARLKEQHHNIAIVAGEIRSSEGELLVECTCTYFTFYNRQNERCTFCKMKGAQKIQICSNRGGHQIGVRLCFIRCTLSSPFFRVQTSFKH